MRHHSWQTSLVALALTVTGAAPLFGQSEATERNTQPSGCTFDVSQFGRSPHTSPELMRLESELIDPQVPVTQTLRSEEHTSELQSQSNLVCRLLLEKKKNNNTNVLANHQ